MGGEKTDNMTSDTKMSQPVFQDPQVPHPVLVFQNHPKWQSRNCFSINYVILLCSHNDTKDWIKLMIRAFEARFIRRISIASNDAIQR
jgi:hypothetical protein